MQMDYNVGSGMSFTNRKFMEVTKQAEIRRITYISTENGGTFLSTYVMSDFHGNHAAYMMMLKEINFSNDDMLYILGDILDRGPSPIKIILDIINRKNIEVVIAGNHCIMAMECFEFLLQEITEESITNIGDDMIEKLLNWQQNGAVTTTNEFHKCDKNTQKKIVDFISDFDMYNEITINDKTFILVYAGLGNFEADKQLWEYELDELVWERPDYEIPYFKNKYVITGHTPTIAIEGNPKPGYIYQINNHIAIDCGCSFPGRRLGCLRIEDMKEFYVELEE